MAYDQDGRAPGEPPNGDFVAYLQTIERAQLAAMSQPHALAPPAPHKAVQIGRATGTSGPAAGARAPLSRDDALALVERLRTQRMKLPLNAGSLMMLLVGALALANALFGDGGLIAFAIGIALLWSPIRRLIAGASALAAAPASQPREALDAMFGRSHGAQDGGNGIKPQR
jgi:hypothetical protein